MDYLLTKIMEIHKDVLYKYEYCKNEDINKIPIGSYILYIGKSAYYKKTGYLNEVVDDHIIKLHSRNKKIKWHIYTNNYYIFYKDPSNDPLKLSLLKLLNSDFKITKKEN
jgi:hypothetical protein